MIPKGEVLRMEKKEYAKRVENASPGSPLLKNCLNAFAVGGLICTLGEGLFTLYSHFGAPEKEAAAWVCITLIFLTALLTGIGVFDKIAKHAGAGTMVPITGFANSMAAPSVEYQTEGRVLGTAVKMFTIAGPVIVYGCSAASLYGMIYYFFFRG
ncbi:MAG: stage V sporulation protein AC [Clostridia bacterium]|nr:stage V sporulation protein AC [Clostridia bacterium]MBQ9506005.1 stage V sporulation protein AC [Clostridia bacterium]